MSNGFVVERLDHFVLTVADIRRSCDFYQNVLGMEVIVFEGDRRALRFGDQKINLQPVPAQRTPFARAPAVGSGDFCLITRTPLEQVQQHLERHNVRVVAGPDVRSGALGPIQSVYFFDPEGNLVEVARYLRDESPDAT